MSFVLVGCTGAINHGVEDTLKDQFDDEKVGVYYSSIDEKEIGQVYNALASYSYELVHYNGNFYTTSYNYTSVNETALRLDSIIGDKIAPIAGNHGVFWSTTSDELSEITYEETLYKVKGYDEQFRVWRAIAFR